MVPSNSVTGRWDYAKNGRNVHEGIYIENSSDSNIEDAKESEGS